MPSYSVEIGFQCNSYTASVPFIVLLSIQALHKPSTYADLHPQACCVGYVCCMQISVDQRLTGQQLLHRANPLYQGLRNRIDSIISQDFLAATEYAGVFEEHRKVYTYGQTWNFEAYSSKKK